MSARGTDGRVETVVRSGLPTSPLEGGAGTAVRRARRSSVGPGSGPAWKKDPDGRRRRVLDEAGRLFSARGYAAVSAAEVAAAAGVAEGNVYHYFGSKQGLLAAVGARYGESFAAAMFEGAGPIPSRAEVAGIVARAFDFVGGNHAGFGLFLLSDGVATATAARRANRETVTRGIEAMLGAWAASGLDPSLDPALTSHLLFGLVESALQACFATGDTDTRRRERMVAATAEAVSNVLRLGHGGGRASLGAGDA